MTGHRRSPTRHTWLTLASAFVLVGSLSVAGGFGLHGLLISSDGRNGANTQVLAGPTGGGDHVGESAAPSGSTDSVTNGGVDVTSASPSASGQASAPATADPRVALESAVIKLANTERSEAGCSKALRADSRLRTAARAHSKDMAVRGYFAHESPDGLSPWERAEAAGYANPSAENIAHGYPSARAVVDAWMASAGHRDNILNCDSKAVGVGVYIGGDGGPYWTQLFGYT